MDEKDDDEDEDEDNNASGEEFVVDKILAKRYNRKTGTTEYLIKWKDYDSDNDNSWEPAANCVRNLPLFFKRAHES